MTNLTVYPSAPGGRGERRGVSRVGRPLRHRFGFDGNPLRRPTDWSESVTRVVLLAAFALLAPVLAMLVGQWAYTQGSAAGGLQASSRHEVRATLLEDAAGSDLTRDGIPLTSTAPVRWTGPDGSRHQATVAVTAGRDAGGTTTVWVDDSGDPVGRPLTDGQVTVNAVAAGLLTFTLTGIAAGLTWIGVSRRIDRRRMAEWDAEWVTFSSRWTGQL